MEENNNNQEFQGQNPPEQPVNQSWNPNSEQPVNQNWNPNSGQPVNQNLDPIPHQNQSEQTYWENGNPDQNSVPPQNTPAPDNSMQFYQLYQQQMNGYNNPMPPSQGQMIQPKKKSHKKLIAGIIVLVLVLSLAATAFAFKDTLLNSYALMTKSPNEYYAFIEEKAIGESVDKVTPYMNLSNRNKNAAYQTSVNVTYDRDTVDSLLQTTLEMGLSDLEGNLGISLDSIGMNSIVVSKDGNVYDSLGLSLNNVDIITMEIFIDSVKQELLMHIPELSPAYLKQSLNTGEFDTGKYLEQAEKLTPERTADFLKRYGTIITNNMNNVELTKNVELTVDKLSVTCNKLTVTIDNETAYNIASAVLDEAKEDEYIYDILPLFDLSEADYQKAVDDVKASLKESIDSSSMDSSVTMNIYVNDRGEIIGRDILTEESGASLGSFSYAKLSKNDYDEFNIYLKDESGNTIFSGNGNQTKEGDSYDGSAKLKLNDPSSSLGLPSDISLDIAYENVKNVTKNGHTYGYGTYTFSSPLAMGIEFILDFNVADDVQQTKATIQMGLTSLVTVDVTNKYLDGYPVPTLSGNEKTFDLATELDGYTSTIDFNAFLSDLSGKLGVDLEGLMDGFIPSY